MLVNLFILKLLFGFDIRVEILIEKKVSPFIIYYYFILETSPF